MTRLTLLVSLLLSLFAPACDSEDDGLLIDDDDPDAEVAVDLAEGGVIAAPELDDDDEPGPPEPVGPDELADAAECEEDDDECEERPLHGRVAAATAGR
jgi:hypothetical protein